jgi:4-hydroxy-tetrahydrodipicolinate reductase
VTNLKVAVSGALGRMGRLTRDAIREAPDLDYAGGFARESVPQEGVFDDLEELLRERKPEVLVDFTVRPVTQRAARLALESGVSPIVGSSEWNESERSDLRAQAEKAGIGAMLVPNFAVGAVLMMRFAEQAAQFFPTIEIVEAHRHDKRDKPSGTAAATAARIREHAGPSDVPIHSVRLRGAVSHQEVLCGNTGELLTIRHDSLSELSFAQGILLAIRNVRNLRGLYVGLDVLLEASTGSAVLRQAQHDNLRNA